MRYGEFRSIALGVLGGVVEVGRTGTRSICSGIQELTRTKGIDNTG